VADTLSVETVVIFKASAGVQLHPPVATFPMAAGSVFTQSIDLRNTGTQSCTTGGAGFDVDLQLDARAQAAGWTAVLYLDRSGKGVVDDQSLPLGPAAGAAPGNVNAALTTAGAELRDFPSAATLNLLVQLSAPASLPPFAVADYAVLVQDRSDAACPNANGAYRALVRSQQVRIRKTQALDLTCQSGPLAIASLAETPLEAAPGQCILYQVEVLNEGASALRNVAVVDAVPTYTHYTVAPGLQPELQCITRNTEGDVLTLRTGPGSGPVASMRCTSDSNTLGPAGSIVMRYSVQLDQ